jgi:hypothetical protein
MEAYEHKLAKSSPPRSLFLDDRASTSRARSLSNPDLAPHLAFVDLGVLHTAALWKSGERPQLKTLVLEGHAGLSI